MSSGALFFFSSLFLLSRPGREAGRISRHYMQDFARQFYKSKAWEQCREAYMHSVGYLCENCKEKGILKTGDTVHHKIKLTPDNINNPEVTLNWNNLMLVCRDCHADIHRKNKNRYVIRADGSLYIPPE